MIFFLTKFEHSYGLCLFFYRLFFLFSAGLVCIMKQVGEQLKTHTLMNHRFQLKEM